MREAQARCDSAEFGEWKAYWQIEPWGTAAFDRLLARHTLNMLAKHGERLSEREFLLFVEPEQPKAEMTLEQAKAAAESFFSGKK